MKIDRRRDKLTAIALAATALCAGPLGAAERSGTPAADADRTGAEVVKARCADCHATGKGGSPRIGDQAAWIPRLKPGLDVVVRSAIRGHGGMPARGGVADLTDAEVRNAIIYMMNPGSVPPK